MGNWMRFWVVALVVGLVVGGCKKRERQVEQPGGFEATGKSFSVSRGEGLCAWKFKYGKNDRLVGVVLPDNREIEYGHDARGNVNSLVSGSFKEGYEYDFFNFLSKISDSTGETLLKRDFLGNLTEIVYPTGDSVKYEYGGTGRVRSVTWGDRHYLRFFRDLLGSMIRLESPVGAIKMQYDYDHGVMERIFPNGAMSRFEFDRNCRPGSIRHIGPQGNVLLEFRCVYDGAGLLTSAVEKTTNGTVNIGYSYDEYDQLVKAVYSDGRVYAYDYDSWGNCVKYSSPTGIQTASYDAYDRLVSLNGKKVVHDRCGNLVSLGSSENYFNVKNLMESDGKYSYRYDGLNLRVESMGREGTSRFIHFMDDLPYVLAETGKLEKRYLWADGHCLGEIAGDRQVLFYFEDHLGSIRGAIDGQGQLIGEAEFSPFGIPIKRITGIRFGYAGEEQDEDGKLYLRSRYYLPQVGRFISMDPAPLRLDDSIKQNRYAYAANSPGNYRDADGAYSDPLNQDIWEQQRRIQTLVNQNRWQKDFFPSSQPTRYYEKVLIGGFGSDPQEYSKYLKENGGEFDLVITLGSGSFPGDLAHSLPDYIGMSSSHASNKFDQYSGCRFGLVVAHSWATMAFESYVKNNPDCIQFDKVVYLGAPKTYSNSLTLGQKFVNVGDPVSWIPELTIINRGDSHGLNRDAFIGLKWTFRFGAGISDKKVYPSSPGLKAHSLDDYLSKPEVRKEIESFDAFNDDEYRKKVPYPPNFPPGGGGGGGIFDSPNVGGVYLDKAAEVLGDLRGIEGVAFDPITNRVILVGNDAGKTTLPPLRLEDLAAASRTVFGDYDTEPGVTIDPDPKNPKADQMIVRFFGGMENTYFGYQLFEADRMMKSLSLGKDNINGKPVKANIHGYYNLLELSFSNLGGSYRKDLWSRFWLVPEQVIVRVSDDKKSITFPDTRIRVKTETMRWQGGQLVPAKGERDEKAEYFAAHFTRYYDDYAKEFPVFRGLKTLANLVGLAKWLKEASINVDFGWLKDYEKTFATPAKTPSLTVSDRRSSMGISVFGGTDLTVKNNYVKDDGSSAKLAQRALLAMATGAPPGLASVTFQTADGKLKRAVALPTLQTRAGGAKTMREEESGLFERVYCSFHNEPGQFGHSWFLDAPRLVIGRPGRGKLEYVMVGNHKVMVRNFRLIGPFGRPDVVFEKPVVDQQYERISFLPVDSQGIRALYVDEEKKEFRVEYSDGRASVFDRLGQILRREDTSTDYLKYSYDQYNRLKSIDRVYQDKVTDQAVFSYDNQGRIESARTKAEVIRYEYNLKGDLENVSTGNLNTGYTYNDRHLVTGVIRNGKPVNVLEYDDFGRVLSEKYADGNLLVRTIKSKAGQTEIVEKTGNQTFEQVYDAGGRLLQWRDNSRGLSVKVDYDAFGSKKSMQWQNSRGETMKAEYSPDDRYVRYTFPDGVKRAFLYDEYGRIKQVQDQEYALLTQEYSLTDRGWYEGTETAEIKMQSFFNRDKQPYENLLTSKIPGGGFLKLESTFTKGGYLRLTQIQGLLNRNYQYDQGRLMSISGSEGNTDLNYDTAGRITEAICTGAHLFFSYDGQNQVSSIREKSREGEIVYEFRNGQLSRRKTLAGRVDTFGLDGKGQIVSARRGTQENWQIQYEPQRISILRNGRVIEESLFDDRGRLIELRR
jgi:RHS repeat-associated protein